MWNLPEGAGRRILPPIPGNHEILWYRQLQPEIYSFNGKASFQRLQEELLMLSEILRLRPQFNSSTYNSIELQMLKNNEYRNGEELLIENFV